MSKSGICKLCAVIAILCGQTSVAVGKAPDTAAGEAAGYAIYYPYPAYPLVAERWHWYGKGLFLLNIDPTTGTVSSIKMLKSTGHSMLDVSAMKALITWRFKLNGPPVVKIPIDFRLNGLSPPN